MQNPYNYYMITLPNDEGKVHVYEDNVDGLNDLGTITELPDNLGFLIRESRDLHSGLGIIRQSFIEGYLYLVEKWEKVTRPQRIGNGSLRPKV